MDHRTGDHLTMDEAASGPVPGADLARSHEGVVRPSRRLHPVSSAPVRVRNDRAANPLARLGATGDQATVALVDEAGALNYLCWPRLDSPLLFGDILGSRVPSAITIAGDPVLCPDGQRYDGDTNILLTSLSCEDGGLEVADAMDPREGPLLARRFRCTSGRVRFTVTACPTPQYATLPAGFVRENETGLRLDLGTIGGERHTLHVCASEPLSAAGGRAWVTMELAEGEEAWLCLSDRPVDGDRAKAALSNARSFWEEWAAQASFEGDDAPILKRSLLACGLLHNDAYGTVAAAATMAFPEAAGGKRNWDYRYVWVRDSAIGALALARGGLPEVARGWLDNVLFRNGECSASPLRLMIAMDGDEIPEEQTLASYSGLMGATPVRMGNGASGQLQLDIIGELVSAYLVVAEEGAAPDGKALDRIAELLAWLGDNWERPDASIWELRGPQRHYLFSRLMSWLAFRDGQALFRMCGREPDPVWALHQASVRADIVTNFWCPVEESYMQTRDKETVDASCVFMRLCGFLEADDRRWLRTKAAVRRKLVRPTGVLRYPHDADDGFARDEGTFVLCTGWWIQTLCMDGYHDEARSVFSTLMDCLGPTGIATEEVDEDGTLLGNVPQLFSHAAIMESVRTLHCADAPQKC